MTFPETPYSIVKFAQSYNQNIRILQMFSTSVRNLLYLLFRGISNSLLKSPTITRKIFYQRYVRENFNTHIINILEKIIN